MKSTKMSTQETIKFNRQNVIDSVTRLKNLANVKFGPEAGRLDFYEYLGEVYRWVMRWKAANRGNRLRNHLAKLKDENAEEPRANADAFHMVIDLTCPRKKGPKSKFAIALRNAEQIGVLPQELVPFLREIGGPTTIDTLVSTKVLNKKIGEARGRTKKSEIKGKLQSGLSSMARAARKARTKALTKSKKRGSKRNASIKVSVEDDW